MWKCKVCGDGWFKREYDITKVEYDLDYDKEGNLIHHELDYLEDILLICESCDNASRNDDIREIANWVEEKRG